MVRLRCNSKIKIFVTCLKPIIDSGVAHFLNCPQNKALKGAVQKTQCNNWGAANFNQRDSAACISIISR